MKMDKENKGAKKSAADDFEAQLRAEMEAEAMLELEKERIEKSKISLLK